MLGILGLSEAYFWHLQAVSHELGSLEGHRGLQKRVIHTKMNYFR